jgi:spore germination protein GerM
VTRRSGLVPAVLLSAVVVLTGCGIPKDGGPRDVPEAERVKIAQAGPVSAQDVNALGPKVFFLSPSESGEELLQSANRDVASNADAVLGALLSGLTTVERTRRWRTAIPSGTELLDTKLEADGTLVVDLNDAFFQATGDAQVKAVAQIVFSAVGIDGVDRVLLLVDGQQRDWPRGDGSLQRGPLTEFDYPSLNPSSQPDYPPIPPPATDAPTG